MDLAVKYGPGMWRCHQDRVAGRRAELDAIAARADQQHAWALQGDDRGVYGPDGAEPMGTLAASVAGPGSQPGEIRPVGLRPADHRSGGDADRPPSRGTHLVFVAEMFR